jgi:hypothetical protein
MLTRLKQMVARMLAFFRTSSLVGAGLLIRSFASALGASANSLQASIILQTLWLAAAGMVLPSAPGVAN